MVLLKIAVFIEETDSDVRSNRDKILGRIEPATPGCDYPRGVGFVGAGSEPLTLLPFRVVAAVLRQLCNNAQKSNDYIAKLWQGA